MLPQKRKDEYPVRQPRSSGIYKACARKHVFGTKHELTEVVYRDASSIATMDLLGTAVHDYIQNDPQYFGDKRIGWWTCLACGAKLRFGPPIKGKCTGCGASNKAIKYEEHDFLLDDPGVSGHPDMFLAIEGGRYVVLEFKTIKPKSNSSFLGFEDLVAPLISHEWQLQTYLWAMQQPASKPPITLERYGYVVYISKGHEFVHPWKWFRHDWNDDLMGRIHAKLDDYKRGCAEYPEWLPNTLDVCTEANFVGSEPNKCPTKEYCKRFYEMGI